MTIWLAIAFALIAATLGVSGCIAYILIAFTRTADLLGTRLGVAELQVIKLTVEPPTRRQPRAAPLRLRTGALPA